MRSGMLLGAAGGHFACCARGLVGSPRESDVLRRLGRFGSAWAGFGGSWAPKWLRGLRNVYVGSTMLTWAAGWEWPTAGYFESFRSISAAGARILMRGLGCCFRGLFCSVWGLPGRTVGLAGAVERGRAGAFESTLGHVPKFTLRLDMWAGAQRRRAWATGTHV